VWTGVPQRLYLALLVAEEHQVRAQHAQADRLLPADPLGRQRRIPVLGEAESGNQAAPIIRRVRLYEGWGGSPRPTAIRAAGVLLPAPRIPCHNLAERST